MFDIGWSEMVVIMLVALVVIGPKDLPRLARTLGQWVAKGRAMAREFQRSLEDMAREAELDDVKREIEKVGRTNVKKSIEKTIDPTGELGRAFDTNSSGRNGGKSSAKASGASAANGEAKDSAASRPEVTSEPPAKTAESERDPAAEVPSKPQAAAKPKADAKPPAEAAPKNVAKPKTEAKKTEAKRKAAARPKSSAKPKSSNGTAPAAAPSESGKAETVGGPR